MHGILSEFVDWLSSATEKSLNTAALPAQWFQQPTCWIGQNLLGTVLVRATQEGFLAARIVETEAYLSDDPASHSWRGKTQRNAAMFASGGHLYVYRIYGIHRCVNIVTEDEGIGSAVLLRAAEPLVGVDVFRSRRGSEIPVHRLLSGPGNLARGFSFDVDDNFRPCYRDGIWILPLPLQHRSIGVSSRIGVNAAFHELRRYFCIDSPSVSAHRRCTMVLE